MMIRQATDKDESGVIELLEQLWPDKRIEREKTRRVIEEYINESDYRIYVCQ
jgi:N-acetylglutamate synthase-like GNAT family acetyltransferase